MAVQGHLEKGAAMLGRAITLFEQSSLWPEWIQAKSFYGSAKTGMGDCTGGISDIKDALAKANELHSFSGVAVSQNCLGFAYLFSGDWQRAAEAGQAAVEAAKLSGDLVYLFVGSALWAWAAALNGQLAVADEQVNRSQEVAQKLGGQVILGDVFQTARAEITLLNGNPEGAIKIAGQLIEAARPLGIIWSVGVSHRVQGQAFARLPVPAWDQAEARMAESVGILESGRNRLEAARTHLAWGEICRDRGNTASALSHWEEANRRFTASNATYEMQKVQKLMTSR
jgi:tetratricopeptide (TPR) repeat protein